MTSESREQQIADLIIVLDATMCALLDDVKGESPAMDALRAAEYAILGLTGSEAAWAARWGEDLTPVENVQRAAARALDLYRREEWLACFLPMPQGPDEWIARQALINDWHSGPHPREE